MVWFWSLGFVCGAVCEVDPSLARENQKLSPRPPEDLTNSNVLNTDDCWLINIKAPATLSVQTAEPDPAGNQVMQLSDIVYKQVG